MRTLIVFMVLAVLCLPSSLYAQERPSSPRGEASTQVGGAYTDGSYSNGSWIVVDYSRPILRGRTNLFGSGSEYGVAIRADAPVWRAGANVSTRFMTERDLLFGDQRLPAGEYSLFIDLNNGDWTFILSNHKAKSSGRSEEEGLWGSYEYTPDLDVVRIPMTVSTNPLSVDQLTYSFVNMTQQGGTLAIMWDKELAMVDFAVSK